MTQWISLIPIIKDLTIPEIILFLLIGVVFLFKNNGFKKQARILKIKYIEILYEQMSFLESVHIDIIFKMRTVYTHICTDKKDIKTYYDLTRDIEREIKSVIRKWFKENHYSDRSESEFQTYTECKIKQILERVSFRLDTEYEGNREALRNINNVELIPYCIAEYRRVFYEARDITKKKEAIIKKLERKFI